jgi:hypothetical protein
VFSCLSFKKSLSVRPFSFAKLLPQSSCFAFRSPPIINLFERLLNFRRLLTLNLFAGLLYIDCDYENVIIH